MSRGNCRLYYIMNMDKDSVVNFLTPTKLIHNSFRQKPKLNLNESQNSNSSNRQKPDVQRDIPPYSFTAQFDKVNPDIGRSHDYTEQQLQLESKDKNKQSTEKNYILNNTSKTVLSNEDNFKLLVDEKYQGRFAQPGKLAFQVQPVYYSAQQPPVGEVLSKLSNSQKREEIEKTSQQKEKPRQQYPPFSTENKNMLKWDGPVDDLNNLMNALRGIKSTIDTELSELQQLLDNTSKFLNEINDEYSRIKQRILDYTSQVLDSSFTRYKENMVNWMKYEDVEKKTIAILGQLQKTIKEDDFVVKEMTKTSKTPRISLGKQQELQQKIQFYGNFANQLREMQKECINMRPQLKKQRIAHFEQALLGLVEF